jgi:hypothetical protein
MQDLGSPETGGADVTDQDDSSAYLAAKIHTRAEVLAQPTPVPHEPGVYGWWFRELPADIDVAGPGHKRPDDGLPLPADRDAAWDLLGSVSLAPTAVIDSGGGLQAWTVGDGRMRSVGAK